MLSYIIRPNRVMQTRNAFAFVGEVQTVQFDFAPWEEDNGSISSVTWTVENGDAAISGESLASSIASAQITTTNNGKSLIKVSATDGTNTYVTYLRIVTKDPSLIMGTGLDYTGNYQ